MPTWVETNEAGQLVNGFGEPVNEKGHLLEPPPMPSSSVVKNELAPLDRSPLLAQIALVGREAILSAASRPVIWLWACYVVAGQVVLVFGAPGGGKTTLLFLLVLARANANALEVLGRRVEPAPTGMYIVLIEGEHEEGSAARKLVKSEQIVGADETALDRVILLARKEVRIGTPKWDEVTKLVERGLVSDIFVDSLARLASTDANSEQEQVAVFIEVGAAIECAPDDVTKPTVWINAHGRKGQGGDVDDVSGSAQRAAQADTILFVKATKDDDDKVISSRVSAVKLREEPEEWPKAVEFSIAKNDAGLWHCTTGGASARTEDTPAHDRVHALVTSKGACTKSEIRAALKLNSERVEKALSVLFAEKRITKMKKTVNGRPFDAFASREVGVKFASGHRLRKRSEGEPRTEAGGAGAGESKA